MSSERVGAVADGWVDAGDAWDWGQGVTTFNGNTRGIAVELTPAGSEALAQRVQIQLVETREEIYNALEISAETKVSYGLSSASATFNLAESVKTTGFDLYLVMSATAYMPRKTSKTEPTLTAAAQKHLEARDFAGFVRMYGDRFIDGMQLGGVYAGILEIHAQSEDAHKQIKAGLSVSVGSGELSADVQTAVTQTMNNYSSTTTTEVLEQALGGHLTPKSIDVNDMIEAAVSFGGTVTPQNAWPMYTHLTDYTELDIPNEGDFADYIDLLREPDQVLEQRRDDGKALQDRLTAAQFANDHPEAYADSADDVRLTVKGDLDTLPGLIHDVSTGSDDYVAGLQQALEHNRDPKTVPAPPPYTMPAEITMPAPQSGVAYTVRSGTGYRLAPGQVFGTYIGLVLANADDDDVNQRWMLSAAPPAQGGQAQIEFINGSSKESVTATIAYGRLPIDGWPDSSPDSKLTFSRAAPTLFGVSNLGDSRAVIVVPHSGVDFLQLHVNALGGDLGGGDTPHPGTPVGIWAAGDGQPNEVWYFEPVH
jgi:hypothetical protein